MQGIHRALPPRPRSGQKPAGRDPNEPGRSLTSHSNALLPQQSQSFPSNLVARFSDQSRFERSPTGTRLRIWGGRSSNLFGRAILLPFRIKLRTVLGRGRDLLFRLCSDSSRRVVRLGQYKHLIRRHEQESDRKCRLRKVKLPQPHDPDAVSVAAPRGALINSIAVGLSVRTSRTAGRSC